MTQLPPGAGSAFRAQITPNDNPYVASADSNARLVVAFGLRNPFRFQIDPARSWLVIADVGQNNTEELDLLRLGGTTAPGAGTAGADFGWPWFEGPNAYSSCNGRNTGIVGPIASYSHNAAGGVAIISAGAYHAVSGGSDNWPAEYEGDLFFSDYYTGILRRLEPGASSWSLAAPVAGQPSSANWGTGYENVSDYRMGPDGALWYVKQSGDVGGSGSVRRIGYDPGVTPPPPAETPIVRTFTSHPQPAVGQVTFDLDLSAAASAVTLRVFDARGRRVRTVLHLAALPSGVQTLAWDGNDDGGERLPAGLYYAHLELPSGKRVHAVTLLR